VKNGNLRALALALAVAGCTAAGADVSPANSSVSKEDAAKSSFLAGGYLKRDEIPDSLTINPPPPAEGSAAEARDRERADAALALQGSSRFRLAAIDAAFFAPDGASVFSCTAGFRISQDTTPKLDAFLKRTVPDLALSTYPTKTHYQRARPFMVNGKATCTPDHEGMLRKDGSYPSGHSAIGYGWGLILAELIPDRAAALVSRGREFGESRRICNVHWQSDVEEGRAVAAAVVARLHANPQFRADLEAAREGLSVKSGSLPRAECALEADALGQGDDARP